MKLFTRKNALLLTAVIILLAAACAFALSREQKALFVSEPALAPSDERDFMSVSVEATGDLRTVKGSMCLTVTNRTGEDLSEIVLRAYPNAIQQGSVTLYGATVNGESVPVGMDSGDPSVWRIQTPWRAGETLEISWQAALIVPRGESVIGRTDESALLIGALPLPAVWENGAWRTDEYDELAETSYGQAVDIQMALTVPKTVLAAFGGAWIDEQDNGDGTKTLAMQLSGAREIAFAMRAEGEIRQTRAGDVLITALAENARTASRLREAAADALEAIEKLGFSYPFSSLTVVQAQTGRTDGVLGSALVAVDADAKADELLAQMTRLCARQIFGVQVENDAWNAPWLSETLASCDPADAAAWRGHRRIDGAFRRRRRDDAGAARRGRGESDGHRAGCRAGSVYPRAANLYRGKCGRDRQP